MYGKLNAILRSKLAMWGITLFAIVLFCITATLASGLQANDKKSGELPAEKIPSIQPQVSGLQVQNSSANTGAQLQGQEGNSSAFQPAASASSSSVPELNAGTAASQVQANGSAGVGPASTSLSASLQPSADLDGNGASNANIHADLNALGLDANLGVKLP